MIQENVQELYNNIISKPDYSTDVKIKNLVNNTFKSSMDAFDKSRGNPPGYSLRGKVAKKRKNAILNNMDRVRKEFADLSISSIKVVF